jgi:hypothetical protein
MKRDIKISRGMHLMRFEQSRHVLWQETTGLLQAKDVALMPG